VRTLQTAVGESLPRGVQEWDVAMAEGCEAAVQLRGEILNHLPRDSVFVFLPSNRLPVRNP